MQTPAARLPSHLPHGGTLPDEVWRSRHRGILLLLWLHVPARMAVQGSGLGLVIAKSIVGRPRGRAPP
jgi:hypothetical protein